MHNVFTGTKQQAEQFAANLNAWGINARVSFLIGGNVIAAHSYIVTVETARDARAAAHHTRPVTVLGGAR